ncbi:MAG: hypothetical protein EPO13_03920 [Actinomycetota bacterium]|nr:MAG: hypothetical protein EPO13_03920 [Actinomycetota bacterium]
MRVLLYLVVLGLTVYALIDVIRAPRPAIRALPKAMWVIIVLVLVVVGPVAWFAWGRPVRTRPAGPPGPFGLGGRRRRPLPPDDDPDFMRALDDETWRRRMEERRRGTSGSSETDGSS